MDAEKISTRKNRNWRCGIHVEKVASETQKSVFFNFEKCFYMQSLSTANFSLVWPNFCTPYCTVYIPQWIPDKIVECNYIWYFQRIGLISRGILHTLWCNQIGTVRKRTLFISLQLMNHTFRQIISKSNFCQTRIRTNRSLQNQYEIISSEVIASRKVFIFQLFPSDCITLYKTRANHLNREIRLHFRPNIWKQICLDFYY